MSRYLPNEVFELDPAPPGPKPHPSARLLDVRGWMFLGMGLAGILTVALIVTADESYAGIDGMRAVRALVPEIEQDVSRLPFLGGIIGAIHDVAPFEGDASAAAPSGSEMIGSDSHLEPGPDHAHTGDALGSTGPDTGDEHSWG